MKNVVYAALIIFSGFSVGCAAAGVFASVRLLKLGVPIAKHAITLLSGVILTQGVLLVRLVQLGTIGETSFATWAYIVGLVVQSIGLLGTTLYAVNRLAEQEAEGNGG